MHMFRRIFLSNCWWQESDIWSQTSYRYAILWEAFLDPSDSYFLFADLVDFYTHWTYMHIFRKTFLTTIDGRGLIFGHKFNIGTPYRGKRFWTHQIPTSCLPTLLIFLHIEHICSFFVAFFSATIDGRNLIFGHKLHIGTPYRGKCFLTCQIPTSCLPKSGGIISSQFILLLSNLIFFAGCSTLVMCRHISWTLDYVVKNAHWVTRIIE